MDEFGTPKQDGPPRSSEPEFAPFERRTPPDMQVNSPQNEVIMPSAQSILEELPKESSRENFSEPAAPMAEVSYTSEPLASTNSPEPEASSIKAGETLARFSVLESAPYARSRKWMYSMLAAVLVILAFAFGVDGWNSLPMAIAFIVLVMVYGMTVKRSDPEHTIPLIFTTYGIEIAGQFYPYTLMRFFFLMEFPDYVHLTIVREGRFVVGTDIYIQKGDDVRKIREVLQEFVPENLSAKESLVQRLIRLLQL